MTTTLETARAFLLNDRFAAAAGVELVSIAPGHALAQLFLEPRHWNGMENVQGGAIFTLADFAFAAAANAHGTIAVAANVSITYMKAAKTGVLRAEARELSKNHRLGTYTVEVTDSSGELVAVFQGLAYRKHDKIPAAP